MTPKPLSLATALLLTLPSAFAAEEIIEGPFTAPATLLTSSGPGHSDALTPAPDVRVYCREDYDYVPEGTPFELHRLTVLADQTAKTATLRFDVFAFVLGSWSVPSTNGIDPDQLSGSGSVRSVTTVAGKPEGLFARFNFTVTDSSTASDSSDPTADDNWRFDVSHQFNGVYMAWRRPSLRGGWGLSQTTTYLPTDTKASCFHSWSVNGGGGALVDPTLYREGGVIDFIKGWIRRHVTEGYDSTKSRNVERLVAIGVRG